VIKASPVLSEGAEAAITPVNNETTTAIADWRDTTGYPQGDGRRRGPPSFDTWYLQNGARFAILISRLKSYYEDSSAYGRGSQDLNTFTIKSRVKLVILFVIA